MKINNKSLINLNSINLILIENNIILCKCSSYYYTKHSISIALQLIVIHLSVIHAKQLTQYNIIYYAKCTLNKLEIRNYNLRLESDWSIQQYREEQKICKRNLIKLIYFMQSSFCTIYKNYTSKLGLPINYVII